jgi:hypothetical protein
MLMHVVAVHRQYHVLKEQIYQRIRNNRRISIDETASEMGVSHGKKGVRMD